MSKIITLSTDWSIFVHGFAHLTVPKLIRRGINQGREETSGCKEQHHFPTFLEKLRCRYTSHISKAAFPTELNL
jgi:hypothetical protein